MADTKTATRPKYRVKVDPNWCKGCGICASFCPKGILAPEGLDQKVRVTDESLCMNCKMCEVHCPDFAICVVVDEAGE
jgi:2-oxoglutarate ferredoxin oxidoreductase subunit delta